MKELFKWAAILGGGYYLFRDQINSLISSTSSTATTSATTTATAAAATAAQATAAAQAATAQQAAATAAAQHAAANPTDQAAQAAAAAAATAAQVAAAQQAATAAAARAAADAAAAAAAAATKTPAPPQASAEVPLDSILMAAVQSKSQAALAGNTLLNVWQWNYYANKAQIAAGQTPTVYPGPESYTPALDPSATMTALTYLTLRPAAGLNGLPGLRAWRFKNYA